LGKAEVLKTDADRRRQAGEKREIESVPGLSCVVKRTKRGKDSREESLEGLEYKGKLWCSQEKERDGDYLGYTFLFS